MSGDGERGTDAPALPARPPAVEPDDWSALRAFTPARLALGRTGAWRWNSPKAGMQAHVHDYFVSRREDD